MRNAVTAPALAMAMLLPFRSLHSKADSVITVRVAGAPSEAQARVTRAMLAEGLSISSTSDEFVQAQGTEKRNTIDVTYSAVILPVDSISEVSLSATATAKARLMRAKVESRITSKLKGAKDVWARMQRMAGAIGRPSEPAGGEHSE
jgi:hypothetical protein